MAHDRVAHLVIRHHLLFIVLKDAALLLQTGHNPLDRFTEVLLLNAGALGTRCEQGSFIHQVGEISAGKTTGGLGDAVEVNTCSELHLFGVDLEDGLAAGEVRTVHQHLPVETAGTQQSCIEHLGLVGGRQNDHRLVLGGEAIHLGEQLVEGLLPFVVAADNAHGARTALADGVQFVNEDDAGRFFLCFFKQVAHASGTGTNEEFHELRAGNDEEGHLGFAGHGLGQQGLTGAGRADQQHTFRNARTDLGIALRALEEVDDLREFLLRLIHARHVGEGDPRLLIGHVHLGLALGEAQRPLSTTAHRAASKELQHQDEDQGRHHPAEDGGEDVRLLRGSCRELNALGLEALGQIHVEDRRGGQHRRRALLGIAQLVANLVLRDEGPLHRTVIHLVDEQGVGHPRHLLHAIAGEEAAGQQQHPEANQHQVDDPEATVRLVVVLADRHGWPESSDTLRGISGNQRV